MPLVIHTLHREDVSVWVPVLLQRTAIRHTECVSALQRRDPACMSVVLGSGDRVAFSFLEFSSYFRAVRNRFLRAVSDLVDVSPYPVAHCDLCGYLDHCETEWERAN